ncbi:MAG: YkgJ family cysteine cluster protein [Desulfosarcina sp.]|nr:YkgJ family cysteine cluster protein [Desulfosarcina sp.]
MEDKKNRLQAIYNDFETAAAPYKTEAACGKGCAFCCTDAGSIHITTLEGLVIRDRIAALPRPRQVAVKKAFAADMKRREQKKPSACPFLMKNRACMIYDVRPFACRRIYSLKICSRDQHPVLSRQVMARGDEAIRALQQLDDTGYSGHLSYILHMLDTLAFLSPYLAGEYNPEVVMAFGKTHGIVINRVMAKAGERIRPSVLARH